ncbi:hypothetical protein EAI_09967 [Harpegnathos saltator]|uniref:Uncharacterized protein n=1 Tax=Harpegnathos saltator TaxID=610380 RepID=E2BJ29_HARSA|nr:hypothetical protein EAI_09967 [Harpegnathos saltator]
MFRAGIFAVLWSLVICSFGFTMDRSALVLSTWDTAPSLDTYQRISVDPTLNSKIQTTDTDKSPQIENAKVMTKLTDGIKESQIREKRSSTENIGVKSIGDITSVKNDDSDFSEKDTDSITGPRNVVLLLIDNKTHDEKRRENRHDHVETLPFTVEGSLQDMTNIEETTIVEKQARSSTPPETVPHSLATLLGIATTLLAVAALTSY